MTRLAPLNSSIPANNWKIIEVFNKLRNKEIIVNNQYQRKLVWKQQHKIDFIETILKNYPFPEIYLAPGNLDQIKLILVDEIVDGQQRLTCIKNYINGSDVFALPNIAIKKFESLTSVERNNFLNYEVSVRYLKNATAEQIRDIFQRINRTDYALNKAERLNAQWGESEFVCFCKQIVEPEFDNSAVSYKIGHQTRALFSNFFFGPNEDAESVFSAADADRMLALQYCMTLVATLDYGDYFNRNDMVTNYVESFNEEFPQASRLEEKIRSTVNFIAELDLPRHSRWFNKANLFTLVVELEKTDRSTIVPDILSAKLMEFDYRATLEQFGMDKEENKLSMEEIRYLSLAREAVNRKSSRDNRGIFIRDLFEKCRI
jgi:hypoxanthine phosphoribosyltransferase